MRIALFGGSFDPIHCEHLRLAEAAQKQLGLDKVVFLPSYRAPHKAFGAAASAEDRLALCRIACRGLPFAEVSDLEIAAQGTSYTYLTCRAFAEKYPSARLFFLVGADMLENFFFWKEPEEILRHVTLVACGRGKAGVHAAHGRFVARFHTDFEELAFTGRDVSSTDLRVALAFSDRAEAANYLDERSLDYIFGHTMYRFLREEGALELLTPERRAHSERVARMACRRARSLQIPEEKALLAAMLHDCAKNVPSDSPLLEGFSPPEDVPAPVLHQYAGAYLAEHRFGVTDEEILDAIRYHTSGREDMTALGKLIFLSDLLEEGRDFEGVGALRKVFWEDLDRCLCLALKQQLSYLEAQKKPVYPLTERAYEWIGSRYGSRF